VSVAGPYAYAYDGRLVADVQRMNLFRQVEIHCLGVGDSNAWLLGELARVGAGVAQGVGSGRVVK
jgi:hypothetical protein